MAEKKEALDKFIKARKPHDWYLYHSLPQKNEPIGQRFGDNKKSVFLQKDAWIPAYLELARTMKDDFVYGKPKLDLYFRGLKTEAKETQFGGYKQPLNLIH